jgi:hypothetical protein
MSAAMVLHFMNVFFAGILAGLEIALHYGLHTPVQVLSDDSQLRLRKALVLRLRVLVPAVFVPFALSAIAVAVLERDAPGAWLRYTAILAVLVWVGVRVIGTIPINSATTTWDVGAPPEDWKALVDHAERFHIVGVWAAVVGFASASCALTVLAFRPA